MLKIVSRVGRDDGEWTCCVWNCRRARDIYVRSNRTVSESFLLSLCFCALFESGGESETVLEGGLMCGAQEENISAIYSRFSVVSTRRLIHTPYTLFWQIETQFHTKWVYLHSSGFPPSHSQLQTVLFPNDDEVSLDATHRTVGKSWWRHKTLCISWVNSSMKYWKVGSRIIRYSINICCCHSSQRLIEGSAAFT